MAFYVYIVLCSDNSYYMGHTDDLECRIAAHNSGEVPGYTASRRPVRLVYSQDFSTRDEAFRAERQIKGWSRAKQEALTRNDRAAISRLAHMHGTSLSTRPQPIERSGQEIEWQGDCPARVVRQAHHERARQSHHERERRMLP